MANIDKLTVISTEGASDVTRQVASTVAQGMQVAGDLTGFDVPQLLAALVARRADATAAEAAPPSPAAGGAVTADGASDAD